MEKTVLFGKKMSQNGSHSSIPEKKGCHNCIKLESQLLQLRESLHTKRTSRPLSSSAPSEIEFELLQLKDKYLQLRRQLEVIEKENDQLFEQNTWMNKDLVRFRKEQLEMEKEREQNQSLLIDNSYEKKEENEMNEGKEEVCCEEHEKKVREHTVEIFVWRQKTYNMQVLMREQNDEIVRLKELIRRKNRLQDSRHTMLEAICC